MGKNHTPDNLVFVTGFRDKGGSELIDAVTRMRHFKRVERIAGCPPERGMLYPNELVAEIEARLDTLDGISLGIGDSYGSLLLLKAACRRRMRDISPLVLIDGPLSPDVEVNPPQGSPESSAFYEQFRVQYAHRVEIARQCMGVLCELSDADLERIVTIGSTEDAIVPPAAKELILPGESGRQRRVRHIELPSHLRGHSLSPPKIAEITRLLRDDILK